MKASLGAGPPGWACKANLQLLWGGHGEWTSPSSGLGMLFVLKSWLTCSREFSVCVHVPKAEAGSVLGSKDGDMKAGAASQRVPSINQAMPHWP